MSSSNPLMPSIGTHVRVLRDGAAEDGVYHTAIVVGHLNDAQLGNVIELRMSNSERLQRTWPTSTIRAA